MNIFQQQKGVKLEVNLKTALCAIYMLSVDYYI